MNIYLAGKISKNGWRHNIVDGLRNAVNEETGCSCPSCRDCEWLGWPAPLDAAIFGKHNYVGPFFLACDHGCFHGNESHGVGASRVNRWDAGREIDLFEYRDAVRKECFCAIDESDLVFAFVDSLDCHGTLIECGYAFRNGTSVVVCFSNESLAEEMWFLKHTACHSIVFVDPSRALASFLDNGVRLDLDGVRWS